MNRMECLREADRITHGPRQSTYGPPEENMALVGRLWAEILGVPVGPAQVALCLAQLKIARLCNSPDHVDSWIDAAAYISIGAECATHGKSPAPEQQS